MRVCFCVNPILCTSFSHSGHRSALQSVQCMMAGLTMHPSHGEDERDGDGDGDGGECSCFLFFEFSLCNEIISASEKLVFKEETGHSVTRWQ